MTSDIEGMTKAAPLSRREFMTAAAATAAGYTLAAGPVCADVIKTDAVGLTVGDAKIAVSGGEMPVYFAKPDGVSNPPVILVAMEVCRGGRTVWVYAAHSNLLKAGVAFYGSLVDPQNPVWPKSPVQLAPDMKAPVLGLYGEADQGIPVSQVEKMKDALKAADKTAEIKIYPGAPHGFHADYRPSYRQEAAEDAWQRMEAWLKRYNVLS